MNSIVNYGLSCLGWPPWSIPLSVVAHELSSYFLSLVDMTCTLPWPLIWNSIHLSPRERLYYLVCQLEGRPPFSNTSGMRSAISSPLTGLGWIRGLCEVFFTG